MADEPPPPLPPLGELRQLPLLTVEELEVLYDCIDEALEVDLIDGGDAKSSRVYAILNSLRTAVGEAKANR